MPCATALVSSLRPWEWIIKADPRADPVQGEMARRWTTITAFASHLDHPIVGDGTFTRHPPKSRQTTIHTAVDTRVSYPAKGARQAQQKFLSTIYPDLLHSITASLVDTKVYLSLALQGPNTPHGFPQSQNCDRGPIS